MFSFDTVTCPPVGFMSIPNDIPTSHLKSTVDSIVDWDYLKSKGGWIVFPVMENRVSKTLVVWNAGFQIMTDAQYIEWARLRVSV
jgi:hypothetical protein